MSSISQAYRDAESAFIGSLSTINPSFRYDNTERPEINAKVAELAEASKEYETSLLNTLPDEGKRTAFDVSALSEEILSIPCVFSGNRVQEAIKSNPGLSSSDISRLTNHLAALYLSNRPLEPDCLKTLGHSVKNSADLDKQIYGALKSPEGTVSTERIKELFRLTVNSRNLPRAALQARTLSVIDPTFKPTEAALSVAIAKRNSGMVW